MDERCEYCDRPFQEVEYPKIQLVDWESPGGPCCAACAVQHLEGTQWSSPGGILNPKGSDDVGGRLHALFESVFWAMVWDRRSRKSSEQLRADETATVKALDAIEQAFNEGNWEQGVDLLRPIGAPVWSPYRDEEKPLFAWAADNCRRTAQAWSRLRTWRVGQLPSDLQRLAVLPPLSAATE